MNRHPHDGRSGQALPLFVILIPGLLALMAMGIDGANVYLAKRDAQGAADLAAVSGAKLLPNEDAANALAETIGIANGYLADEVTPNAHYGGDDTKILVTVERDVPTYFMPILNFFGVGDYSKWTVDARAVAQLYPGSSSAGPGAIFAGGTCTGGKYGVDVSGQSDIVRGGVHSNSDVNIGSTNDFTDPDDEIDDPFTYVGSIKDQANGTYQPGYPQQVGVQDWPDGFAPSDVGDTSNPPPEGSFLRPYYDLAVANGTWSNDKIDSITTDGVYYSNHEDGMDISSISGSSRNVVLVAPRGPIKISGSSDTLNPFTHPSLPSNNLLMVSGKTYTGDEACDKFVIATSGSSITWNGVLWGPGGLVELSGSNETVTGSLVGWAVRVNGSTQDITSGGGGSSSDPSIALVE